MHKILTIGVSMSLVLSCQGCSQNSSDRVTPRVENSVVFLESGENSSQARDFERRVPTERRFEVGNCILVLTESDFWVMQPGGKESFRASSIIRDATSSSAARVGAIVPETRGEILDSIVSVRIRSIFGNYATLEISNSGGVHGRGMSQALQLITLDFGNNESGVSVLRALLKQIVDPKPASAYNVNGMSLTSFFPAEQIAAAILNSRELSPDQRSRLSAIDSTLTGMIIAKPIVKVDDDGLNLMLAESSLYEFILDDIGPETVDVSIRLFSTDREQVLSTLGIALPRNRTVDEHLAKSNTKLNRQYLMDSPELVSSIKESVSIE